MLKNSLLHFLNKESATGILLVMAMLLAMIMANSPLYSVYTAFIATPVSVTFGELVIAKPLLLWINDGLMAIFFFMVGMEIKREVVEGSLSDRRQITLPTIAALGGMALPVLIFSLFNMGNDGAMAGWAIPAATDIAFALGVLSLLGRRVPVELKIFLLALAIIDDIGAIVIIAFFYTSELSLLSLGIAGSMFVLLFILNRKEVTSYAVYLAIAVVLWTALMKSGVHATLAGVLMGLFIPLKNDSHDFYRLERAWHTPVNFVILPLFAFANAGIDFGEVTLSSLYEPLTIGIALGLFIGKQVGVFGFTYLAIKLGIGRMPENVTWGQLYGVALLSGIGFTMSLFIGSLAFECTGEVCFNVVDERMGIIIGSLLSGVTGYMVLKRQLRPDA